MSRPYRIVRIAGYVLGIALACLAFYHLATWLVQTFFASDQANAVTSTSNESVAETEDATAAREDLQKVVDTMTDNYGSQVGIVLVDITKGARAEANADTRFVSASIYKLFVAYAVYVQIDTGDVAYGDTLSAYGTSSTVEECLDLMLTISDNTCGVALGRLYGWSALDDLLAAKGYNGTQLDNYDSAGNLDSDKLTTASDVALLLQRLYDGTLLSAASTEQFISLLKADEINYMLPSGLPSGTVVAHKVGYLEDYQHDAGIIYSQYGDLIVVMFTKGWQDPTGDAAAAFARLGQATWAYLSTR